MNTSNFQLTRQTKPVELETEDRDMTSGIPSKEKKRKDVEVGLTEFPAGQDPEKDPGYSIPFHTMDSNFNKTRDADVNYRNLPITRMTVDMINRMFNHEDYNEADTFSQNRMSTIDRLIDGGGGKVTASQKKPLTQTAQVEFLGNLINILNKTIIEKQGSVLLPQDLSAVISTTARQHGLTYSDGIKTLRLFQLAQKPTVQKSWPSMYDEPSVVETAPAEVVQAYDEVQDLQNKLSEIDAIVAEMKKKADAEISQYKEEQGYDELVQSISTKWGTLKQLVRGVKNKITLIGDKLLAVIEKRERSSMPNPTMFKDALINALPELESKINDIYEKARTYSEVSKFYLITNPPKNVLEKSSAIDDTELQTLDTTLEGIQEDLFDMSGLLGKVEVIGGI